MKNRKAISWIFIAIVLTIAAHLFLSYKGDVAASLVQRSALIDEPFTQPDRLSVEVRGKSAAVIEKQGANWRMVSPYAALADERAVMRLLDILSVTMIDDTLGDQELLKLGRTREDFGLEEPEAKIRVKDGKSQTEIAFGCMTPAGRGVYATVNDERAVYVVSSNVFAAANLPPDGFRNRRLFPELGAAVSSFDLKRGTGSFMRFMRMGDAWMMNEPEQSVASANKIKDLLAAASSATAVEFVWPVGAQGEVATASASLLAGYGLDPESAVTLTIRCSDGVDSQVSFGKEAKDGLVYALVQGAGAIVTVDAKLKDLALAGAQDFTDTRLFPLDARTATRISVSDGGVNYLLAKDDSGEWRLDAPVVAKTDKESVDKFLKRLFELKSTDLDADGISVIAVTSAPPRVVSRAALLGDMRLEDLRSREIINVAPAAVRRLVTTPRGEKPTAVVYDKDRRAWNIEVTPVPGSVSSEGIENVLAALSPVKAETIVKLKVSAAELREYGLETPRVSVAVDSDNVDSIRRNLLIGDKAEEGGFYATLGATDAVFVISEETVSKLMSSLVKADGSEIKDEK